jgi:hypothetical protein
MDTPVSSINKTDRHDITEILLKVVLSTMNKTPLSAKKTKQNKKKQKQKEAWPLNGVAL